MATDFNTEYSTALGRLRTGLVDAVGDFKKDVKAEISELRQLIDMTRAEMLRPDGGGGRSFGGGGFETAGRKVIKQTDALDLFKKTGRSRISVGSFFPMAEEKSLLDSGSVGWATPGGLSAERIVPGIVAGPRRRLFVSDLLRRRPVTMSQADFLKENVFSSGASPQVEGYSKGESSVTFAIASSRCPVIAHWIKVTRQILDDLPGLREFLDTTMLDYLRQEEEDELLFGDATGDHLSGINNQASVYTGAFNTAADTRIDRLRHVILELENANENCSAFILNPTDVHAADLVKQETNGANTGSYVLSDPGGPAVAVRTIWGRPVVSTTAITAGTFLAGDFSRAFILDRQQAVVDISQETGDCFTTNSCVIRAECRTGLAVLRPSAFLRGNF
jgi:HK97 family phage major capsid protein